MFWIELISLTGGYEEKSLIVFGIAPCVGNQHRGTRHFAER
jgi:hypothetical protein